jgi:hypothetical protein
VGWPCRRPAPTGPAPRVPAGWGRHRPARPCVQPGTAVDPMRTIQAPRDAHIIASHDRPTSQLGPMLCARFPRRFHRPPPPNPYRAAREVPGPQIKSSPAIGISEFFSAELDNRLPYHQAAGALEEEKSSQPGKCSIWTNGAGHAKGLAQKSFLLHPAKKRSAVTDKRMKLCHHLGNPSLGGFRGIRQSNNKGGATVGFAVHA